MLRPKWRFANFSQCQAWLLTIVGGGREAWSVWRLGRLGTVCARGAHPAWSSGPSTSPLDVTGHAFSSAVPGNTPRRGSAAAGSRLLLSLVVCAGRSDSLGSVPRTFLIIRGVISLPTTIHRAHPSRGAVGPCRGRTAASAALVEDA